MNKSFKKLSDNVEIAQDFEMLVNGVNSASDAFMNENYNACLLQLNHERDWISILIHKIEVFTGKKKDESKKIAQEPEKPFAVEIGKGQPREVKKPETIEQASDDIKQIRDRIKDMSGKKSELQAKVNEAVDRVGKEVAPFKKEISELEQKIQSEGQPLGQILQSQEEAWRKIDTDLMVVIDKIEKSPVPISDEKKLEKIFEIVTKLGWDVEKLQTEFDKAVNGMTRYNEKEIKRIVIYPEHRPPTAKAVMVEAPEKSWIDYPRPKLADIWSGIKNFFTGIWDIVSGVFSSTRKVLDDTSKLKRIIVEE